MLPKFVVAGIGVLGVIVGLLMIAGTVPSASVAVPGGPPCTLNCNFPPAITFSPPTFTLSGLTLHVTETGVAIKVTTKAVNLTVNGVTSTFPSSSGLTGVLSLQTTYSLPKAGNYTIAVSGWGTSSGGAAYSAFSTSVKVDTFAGSGGGGGSTAAVHPNFAFTTFFLRANFTDQSTAVNATVNESLTTWNFGDGSTGAGASVSHLFTASGTYSVTERVTAKTPGGALVSANVTYPVTVNTASGGGGGGSGNGVLGNTGTVNSVSLGLLFASVALVAVAFVPWSVVARVGVVLLSLGFGALIGYAFQVGVI